MSQLNYIQANTDGHLHDAATPSISPLNRGFLYGDAIYEVWRTYDGIIYGWDEHWQRLNASADSLHMELGLDQASLLREIRRTTAAFAEVIGERPELYIRLQISRGAGPIGLNPHLADQPSFVILVQRLGVPSDASRKAGIKLGLAKQLKRNPIDALNPAWKSGNYLNNIMGMREALAAGADEVIMENMDGEISESAVSNIFFIKDGKLFTPPVSSGILIGITRATIINSVGPALGFEVVETPIRSAQLREFDECFICSTTKEVMPVASIDQHQFAIGEDTLGMKLEAEFRRQALEVCAARGDLSAY